MTLIIREIKLTLIIREIKLTQGYTFQIIHRDLTSKNCLLRQDGTVVVADFGLAQYQQTSLTNYTYLSPPIAPGKRTCCNL